jgi:hypothetical protein
VEIGGRSPAAAPAFDVQSASEVLNDLGRMIVDNPAIRALAWEGLTLVSYDEGTGLFGYAYLKDGSWKAVAPDGFSVLRRAGDLNRAMSTNGDPLWKNALIQLRRSPELQLNVKFEYEDGARWRVTPANLEERMEELRPR